MDKLTTLGLRSTALAIALACLTTSATALDLAHATTLNTAKPSMVVDSTSGMPDVAISLTRLILRMATTLANRMPGRTSEASVTPIDPLAYTELNLLQAYEAALTNDAALKASRATNASVQERLPQARAQLGPNLSANLSRNKNNLTSTAPNLMGTSQTTHFDYFSDNQTLTLRQPLIRPYQLAQYEQAKAQVADADAVLEKDLDNLGVRVSGAYLEALLADDNVQLAQAQITTYTALIDAARKALIAGSGTRTDIDDAQSKLDMAVAQALEAQQNQDYTLRQVQILVGLLSETSAPALRLAPLGPLPLLPPNPALVEDWINKALSDNPEITSLRAQREAAAQEIAKAESGHYPTLDATAQWSRSDSENVLSPRSRYDNKVLGLQLSIPLYAGGATQSAVRQALAEQNRVEAALDASRRDLGLRIHKEFRGVTEGILRIRALEQALRSAEQLVLSTRKSMTAGSRTQLDILSAEQQHVAALRNIAQARYTYLLARIRLQALSGGDRLAAITEVNGWLQGSNLSVINKSNK